MAVATDFHLICKVWDLAMESCNIWVHGAHLNEMKNHGPEALYIGINSTFSEFLSEQYKADN
jgi:hypothetical protein